MYGHSEDLGRCLHSNKRNKTFEEVLTVRSKIKTKIEFKRTMKKYKGGSGRKEKTNEGYRKVRHSRDQRTRFRKVE